jgi:hypothetical protein
MKSFSKSFQSFYDNEVKNLSTLGESHANGVVQYLGSFRHAEWPAHLQAPPNSPAGCSIGTDSDTMSYHILLEFGDNDLLDLFEEALPAHHAEIRLFWLDLFRVAKALEELHELKIVVEGTSETASAYVPINQSSSKSLIKIGSMVTSNQRT